MRIGILEPDGFSPVARKRLEQFGEVSARVNEALEHFVSDKDVLFIRLAHHLDGAFLSAAAKLRIICSPTTGLTHVDLEMIARRQIRLLSLKGETSFLEGIRATPEHIIGLLLALLRCYRSAFLTGQNDHWDRDRCRGEELYRMPIGLVGFGRVGKRVASYLHSFGSLVNWYDPFIKESVSGATRCGSLEELITASRAVVLAAAYAPGAPPIIDARAVAGLAGKYFVNIARGELVDEDALIASVERGELAGCAVDVVRYEHETANRRRWIAATRAANVIVTPHIGGATFTSMQATEEFLVEKLAVFLGSTDAFSGRVSSL